MIKSFLAFLGGEPGEEKPMLLLLGMGFFMGIFIATYQIGSETLFLSVLGEEYLDVAFFTTGALGILSTAMFVYLQKRINYSTLAITNLFLIFSFMTLMYVAFMFTGYNEEAAEKGFQLLPFIMFVMIGPITAITLLNFWGVFGRMFDVRASKRIIGGIDTGQLTATIIAFFSIPFITRLPFINNTYDLLLVAAFTSFGVFFFTIWIVKDYNINKATKRDQTAEKPKDVKFLDLMKDPYLRMLSVFLIFSMGASVFVNYTYYSSMEIMYPEKQELADLLSVISGIVMLTSFFIQSFINDIIIGKFGLRIALMTMPIILGLFTVGGIIAGHIFGYAEKTDEFILFFLFTVCAKVFTSSLKDALESPAFKLFFLPIDIRIRFDIQTRIEGVVNQFATLAAGAAQIALGLLSFFQLIHYSYFLLGLAGMVIWLAGRLFIRYKETLKKTLAAQKSSLGGEGKRNDRNPLNVLKEEIRHKDPDRTITGLKLLERLEPIQYDYALLDLLSSRHPGIRAYAYAKLEEYLYFDGLAIIKREVKTEGDESVLKVAKGTLAELEKADQFQLTEAGIRQLVRSTEYKQRIRAARLLAKSNDDKYLPFLLELLRDINPEVRIAAIVTAGKLRRPELWPVLIENLHLSSYSNAAMSALHLTGEAGFHNIDTSFYKTGQYKSTMFRIVQLLGRIGGKGAVDLLWKKIDYPDKNIVSELLLSLSYLGFEARDFQRARIKIAMESDIGDIAWNIKALKELPDETDLDRMIREAFGEENEQNYTNIFMFLSMIYDPQNVFLVKENIESATSESITFAVEMLDIFIEEDLKPKLIPIMDEMKVDERLEKLTKFFAPEEFVSHDDLLLQIVNRDYNRINRYTKALVLFRLGQIEGIEVSNALIANLFNPDPLLLQTAAHSIYQLDKAAYHRHTARLKPSTKKELDRAIVPPVFQAEDDYYHHQLLLIERVLLLKEIKKFSKIPGELITYLAESMEEIAIAAGTKLIDEKEGGDVPMYIVVEGEVDVTYQSGEQVVRKRKGFIGHERILSTEQFDYVATARSTSILLVLRKEELMNLMSRHVDIMTAFIEVVNNIEVEEKEEEYSVADILLSN